MSKCVTDLASFYKKCSFSPAEAPFSSWAERGTKMMCLELLAEDYDDEEEKVPGKSSWKKFLEKVPGKSVAKATAATPKKHIVVKKPLRERSAFEDSDESDDVGLAPAEGKPVQIDTSTIKVAAKTKKVVKPGAKP